MEQVLRLAENYMMQRVVGANAPLTHVNKAVMIGAFIALIVGLGAIGFILFGVFDLLMQTLPLYEASMVFGAILLVLSVLIVLSLCMMVSMKKQKIRNTQQNIKDEIFLNFKLAEQELRDLEFFDKNPKTFVALATLAGYILGDRAL